MTKFYLVTINDQCGDCYNDKGFFKKEDAINYCYNEVKNDRRLKEWYIDEGLTDITFEQYVKNMLREDMYIEETIGIEEITVT